MPKNKETIFVRQIREAIESLVDSETFCNKTALKTNKLVSKTVSDFMEGHLKNVQFILDEQYQRTYDAIVKEFTEILRDYGLYDGQQEKIRLALDHSNKDRLRKERLSQVAIDRAVQILIVLLLGSLGVGIATLLK